MNAENKTMNVGNKRMNAGNKTRIVSRIKMNKFI